MSEPSNKELDRLWDCATYLAIRNDKLAMQLREQETKIKEMMEMIAQLRENPATPIKDCGDEA